MARKDDDRRNTRNDRNPYVTPRLIVPYAQDTRAPGERLPLARQHFPLQEWMRMPIWYACERCQGQGTLEPLGDVICHVCRLAWHAEDVLRMAGPHWRALRKLPCGCPVPGGEPTYTYPPCPMCGGDGWIVALVSLTDWLDWLEALYASMSQQTTARHKAV